METYELTREELKKCISDAKEMVGDRGTLDQVHQFAKSNIGKLIYFKLMYAKIDQDLRDKFFADHNFVLRDGKKVIVKTICKNDNRVYVKLSDTRTIDLLTYVVIDYDKNIVKDIIFGFKDFTVVGHIGGTFENDGSLDIDKIGTHTKDGRKLTYIKINKERTQYEQDIEIDF